MRKLLRALIAVVLTLLVTSCGFDVTKLPLPGGADTGDDPIEVTVVFPDALDLVPQSTVKVADVTIGKVTDIELVDYRAEVTMELRNDTGLPANALAEIRQTSLLGEKFVSLSAPDQPSAEKLGDGDHIEVSATNRNPEVEEVLSALSLVLNGGGVAQLKTISSELNKALGVDKGKAAKSVLTQLRVFMKQLDDNKGDIVTAIESLNKLSITANKHEKAITTALDDLPEALDSLDKQRADLVKMLKALSKLGKTGTRVIKASKTATIDALGQLAPVLTQLANTDDDFVNAFHVALTFPFVDESVGRDPQVARNLHMGDYVNLAIKLDIRLDGSMELPLPTLLPSELEPTEVVNNVLKCLTSGNLGSKACRDVLATPGKLLKLQELCRKPKNRDREVCKVLNPLPDLGLGDLVGEDGSLLPGLPNLSSLPGLPGVLGRTTVLEQKVTLQDMTEHYDPTLVRLLLPGVAQ